MFDGDDDEAMFDALGAIKAACRRIGFKVLIQSSIEHPSGYSSPASWDYVLGVMNKKIVLVKDDLVNTGAGNYEVVKPLESDGYVTFYAANKVV